MDFQSVRAPRIFLGEDAWNMASGIDVRPAQDHIPKAANENLKLKADWMTPSEALQLIQRIKQRLRRENAETHSFFSSPARRRVWDEINSCEACLLWHYFR